MEAMGWVVFLILLPVAAFMLGGVIGRWSALEELKDVVAPPPDDDDDWR